MKKTNHATEDVTRILCDDGQRCIGEIRYGVFTKFNWRSSRHLCRKYEAIGIDEGAFTYCIEDYASSIKVPDLDTRKTYLISIQQFRLNCIKDNLAGWGPQLFCPLQYFQVMATEKSIPSKRSIIHGELARA